VQNGYLPLHLAVSNRAVLEVVVALLEAHPKAEQVAVEVRGRAQERQWVCGCVCERGSE